MRPGLEGRVLVRAGVSAALLVALGLSLDPSDVLRPLRTADLSLLWLALVVSIFQVGGSAWRWCYTARRIGIPLSFPRAVREYYLATFVNQVLPGGVLGDVSRAWRHGSRADSSRGSAARAVILERASGQMVMLVTATICMGVLLSSEVLFGGRGETPAGFPFHATGEDTGAGFGGGLAAGIAGSVLVLGILTGVALGRARVGGRRKRVPRLVGKGFRTPGGLWGWMGEVWSRSWDETRRALFSPGAFLVQTLTSFMVVASYVVVYVLAARAVGVTIPTTLLVLLVPPILVAMLIPLSFAGWGLREGAAALLWTAAGLSASEGAAASVTYGILILASSLPGAVVLMLGPRPRSDPDRRARPFPSESGGPGVGGPGRGSPPAEG